MKLTFVDRGALLAVFVSSGMLLFLGLTAPPFDFVDFMDIEWYVISHVVIWVWMLFRFAELILGWAWTSTPDKPRLTPASMVREAKEHPAAKVVDLWRGSRRLGR